MVLSTLEPHFILNTLPASHPAPVLLLQHTAVDVASVSVLSVLQMLPPWTLSLLLLATVRGEDKVKPGLSGRERVDKQYNNNHPYEQDYDCGD